MAIDFQMARRRKPRKHRIKPKQGQETAPLPKPLRQDSRSSKTIRTHCIILFILGFAIYANSLSNGYVLDDTLFITGNSYTQQGV
ncbi:MAG: hypothetical protein ACE5DN_03635, partial [Flavobacteriales bacterium]